MSAHCCSTGLLIKIFLGGGGGGRGKDTGLVGFNGSSVGDEGGMFEALGKLV